MGTEADHLAGGRNAVANTHPGETYKPHHVIKYVFPATVTCPPTLLVSVPSSPLFKGAATVSSTSGQLAIDECVQLCQAVTQGNTQTVSFWCIPQWHSSAQKVTVLKNRRLMEDKIVATLCFAVSLFLLDGYPRYENYIWSYFEPT